MSESKLGDYLREAREKKGISASQAAAATRIKIQHIEDLEANNYGRLSVPAYAKGFIKIYAEYLGLHPAKLIREYDEHFAPEAEALKLKQAEAASPRSAEDSGPDQLSWFQTIQEDDRIRRTIALVAVALIGVFILIGIYRLMSRLESAEEKTVLTDPERRVLVEILMEPPEPYWEGGRERPGS